VSAASFVRYSSLKTPITRADVPELEARRALERLSPMQPQPVADPTEVLLIAREAREVEGEQHVPLVYTRDELEESRPVVARRAGGARLFEARSNTTWRPRRSAKRRHSRTWSAIEASLCLSVDMRA
jgi:hypothetical protein